MSIREIKAGFHGFCPTCKKATTCTKLRDSYLGGVRTKSMELMARTSPSLLEDDGARIRILKCDDCYTEFASPSRPILMNTLIPASQRALETQVQLSALWRRVQSFKLR